MTPCDLQGAGPGAAWSPCGLQGAGPGACADRGLRFREETSFQKASALVLCGATGLDLTNPIVFARVWPWCRLVPVLLSWQMLMCRKKLNFPEEASFQKVPEEASFQKASALVLRVVPQGLSSQIHQYLQGFGLGAAWCQCF